MGKIFVPVTGAEDWGRVIEPGSRWHRGGSAQALAHCWHETDAVPETVRRLFTSLETFRDFEILLAIPEHPVDLPGGSYPAKNDVWALGRNKDGLISLVVKGMAREPFGETLRDWRRDYSGGKRQRLEFLCSLLDLDLPLPDGIRYPLLKWTAAAVVEAVRFHAGHAVFLVHSFSPARHWFEDFRAFVALLGGTAVPGKLMAVGERMGIPLHLGWVSDEADFLTR